MRSSLSQDGFLKVSGRLAGHTVFSLLLLASPQCFRVSFTRHTMGWRVLPPFGPSRILLVSFLWQHRGLYQDLLCETTQARGYHRAWPRQAVSVNGSLTEAWVRVCGTMACAGKSVEASKGEVETWAFRLLSTFLCLRNFVGWNHERSPEWMGRR